MENNNREFKGVWIPKEIWLNTDLSVIEKCLIVEIDSLDNGEKGCFASNEYLGNFIGVKEGTAANMISNLKKRGYISQVFFDGRNRGLRINKNVKAAHENESCVHEKMKADPIKKLKQTTRKNEHSNTSNNTDNNTVDKEREHAPDKKDIIIYTVKENKEDVAGGAGGGEMFGNSEQPQTYEELRAQLWRKSEVDGKLAAYLRNLELPLLSEKSKIVFEKVFDKWLAYQLSEKSKLNICDGTEESAIKLLHNQWKGKVSIFMALNNWTCSVASKSEAKKYLAELNKPAQSKAPEQLRYAQPKRQRNNDEY